MKIIVSGMVAGNPGQGGAAWAVLHYVLGLSRLGHEVYLIEPIAKEQLLPTTTSMEQSTNAGYFSTIVKEFGLTQRASMFLQGGTETIGLSYSDLRAIARDTTVLFNISGMLREPFVEQIPYRVYLDLDPAFNQLWHYTQDIDMNFDGHNCFVTVGNALGHPECPIPTGGVQWIQTFQPVVLPFWRVARTGPCDGFTTIGNWRGYGSIQHDGVFYGQKAHSLRAFIDLPLKTAEKFILALAIHPGEHRDLEALEKNRWTLVDPSRVADTPERYRDFITASKAEFGIAKSGYVESRCGWFSDRSACYLASGRPVLAQDTGFGAFLPCGTGLFSFRTAADVLSAIDAINCDYQRHARAARAIAVEYFDSDKVLSRLLRTIGIQA
jgi:hypothetical protein